MAWLEVVVYFNSSPHWHPRQSLVMLDFVFALTKAEAFLSPPQVQKHFRPSDGGLLSTSTVQNEFVRGTPTLRRL